MRLRKVLIENFRGIRSLVLDELGDMTVLIGENNSGKTAVLDALKLCLRELGPRRKLVFDPMDFHLKDASAQPADADPIRIELTFSETAAGEWGGKQTGQLQRLGILQVDAGSGLSHVRLRVTCGFDPSTNDFAQDWAFLATDSTPLPKISENALATLQRSVSYFYLSALRDAGKHFDAKGPFWRHFLKDSHLSHEQKTTIESKLREVNDLVVQSHDSFGKAADSLKRVQEVVPMSSGTVVSIEAVPGRLFDMLARAQVNLGATTGARVPVGRHGEGTQSLAVLMLFSAFLEAGTVGAPIIGLEEPEAHLHPSAVRALWGIIGRIPGQKLIATHSGYLLSEVDVHDVRRLSNGPAGVLSWRLPVGVLNAEESRKFFHHVRRVRGELLFARSWLLVEGETESWIYPAAARALSYDLHREGVRVVEYSQSDVGLLAKVANAFGIPWYCVTDGDSGRAKYERPVLDNLNGSAVADRLTIPYTNIEVNLLAAGFDGVYAKFMPSQNLAKMTKPAGDPEYWPEYASLLPDRAKTRAGAAVAAEIESRGKTAVTAELRDAVEKAVQLARA